MWWQLRHGDTQRRRIRYIGKVNNRVYMESFDYRAPGLCRQNPARSMHLVETDGTIARAARGGGRMGRLGCRRQGLPPYSGAPDTNHPTYFRRRYSILYFACVVSPVARRIKS